MNDASEEILKDDAARSSLPCVLKNDADEATPSALVCVTKDEAAPSSLPLKDGAGLAVSLPKRRWGTVQRMSPKVRLFINRAMRDGLTYKQILVELAKKRVTSVSVKQLRDWHRTGYADWLNDQVYFERLTLQLDATQPHRTPKAGKKNFRELSQLEIATQLHAAARKFNLEKFCQHLNSKPESYFRFLFANALHERNAIMRDRMELESEKHRAVSKKVKREAKPKRGGVTREEMERIERRINL